MIGAMVFVMIAGKGAEKLTVNQYTKSKELKTYFEEN